MTKKYLKSKRLTEQSSFSNLRKNCTMTIQKWLELYEEHLPTLKYGEVNKGWIEIYQKIFEAFEAIKKEVLQEADKITKEKKDFENIDNILAPLDLVMKATNNELRQVSEDSLKVLIDISKQVGYPYQTPTLDTLYLALSPEKRIGNSLEDFFDEEVRILDSQPNGRSRLEEFINQYSEAYTLHCMSCNTSSFERVYIILKKRA